MSENRLKRFSPHILFILLSIFIPIFSVYISYTLYNTHIISHSLILDTLMSFTPIYVMLILFVIGRRYLTGIDIELYGGLSSRFLILSWILIMGPIPFIAFFMIPFYGFITPIEFYIGMLAPDYIGLSNLIYPAITILICLSIATLYLYLLFIGRRNQEKAMKIYYLIVVILGFIYVIGEARSRFLAFISLIQFWFVLATAARWISKIFGIRRKQVNYV